MAKPVDDFKDYLLHDVLGHLKNITAKRMFGGYGLYHEGNIFAFITGDDAVCFKVDKSNQPEYEEMGSKPFIYDGHTSKKPITMPYWYVPEEVLEDRERIARMVVESADISKAAKK